jgi:hypothetical protein
LAFTGENDLALVVRAAYGGLVNRNLRLQLGWTARTIGVDTWGFDVFTTVTVAAARVPLRTASASAREIF